MKGVLLEGKGREKEPQQPLALGVFATLILLAGSAISPSASRSVYTKLPPPLRLHGSKVAFLSLLFCTRSRTTCPCTCPHRWHRATHCQQYLGTCRARAAAWVNLFLVWIEKLDLEACSSLLLQIILSIYILKFNIFSVILKDYLSGQPFVLYSPQKSPAAVQEDMAEGEGLIEPFSHLNFRRSW